MALFFVSFLSFILTFFTSFYSFVCCFRIRGANVSVVYDGGAMVC